MPIDSGQARGTVEYLESRRRMPAGRDPPGCPVCLGQHVITTTWGHLMPPLQTASERFRTTLVFPLYDLIALAMFPSYLREKY